MKYVLAGRPVCRSAFQIGVGVSKGKLDRVHHYLNEGVTLAAPHGNTGSLRGSGLKDIDDKLEKDRYQS